MGDVPILSKGGASSPKQLVHFSLKFTSLWKIFSRSFQTGTLITRLLPPLFFFKLVSWTGELYFHLTLVFPPVRQKAQIQLALVCAANAGFFLNDVRDHTVSLPPCDVTLVCSASVTTGVPVGRRPGLGGQRPALLLGG